MDDSRSSVETVTAAAAHFIKTKYEFFDYTRSDGRKFVKRFALIQDDATHVEVGIQWGGNAIVSVEGSTSMFGDQNLIGGKLTANLLFSAVKLKAGIESSFTNNTILENLKFTLYGDVGLNLGYPNNLEEAFRLIRSLPDYIKNGIDGKGVALYYSMLPIHLLRKYILKETNTNSSTKFIDESTVEYCYRLFDEIKRDELRINELTEYLNNFKKYIAKDNKIKNFVESHQNYRNELRDRLWQLIVFIRARSPYKEMKDLINALNEA